MWPDGKTKLKLYGQGSFVFLKRFAYCGIVRKTWIVSMTFLRSKRLVLWSCSRTSWTCSGILCGFTFLTMRQHCRTWSMDRHPSPKETSLLAQRGAKNSVCRFAHVDSKSNPVDGPSWGRLDGPWKVKSLAFPGSLLRALRLELGGREGS